MSNHNNPRPSEPEHTGHYKRAKARQEELIYARQCGKEYTESGKDYRLYQEFMSKFGDDEAAMWQFEEGQEDD